MPISKLEKQPPLTKRTMLVCNTYKPTYLYIKKHNVTGLKYFGKTVRDPLKYKGSGQYWLTHLKQHGNDVTTEWCKLFHNVKRVSRIRN